MKFAISNIAWNKDEDDAVYAMMQHQKFSGLEIAPTRQWESPFDRSKQEYDDFLSHLGKFDISPIAMQSLLYGYNGLNFFDNQSVRDEMISVLKARVDLAAKLGIKVLVFGSPKNRVYGDLTKEKAWEIAAVFFRELAQYAKFMNTCLCIEPNPKEYSTNFINTSLEGLEFVKLVDCDGVGLHIDTGTMILNEENPDEILPLVIPHAKHFHVSEPFLESISSVQFHKKSGKLLKELMYTNWISIEMKRKSDVNNIGNIKSAFMFLEEWYS